MTFIPVLDNKCEVAYFECIEKNGSIIRNTVITLGDEYYNIRETIYHGKDKIYNKELTLDDEILDALISIKNNEILWG